MPSRLRFAEIEFADQSCCRRHKAPYITTAAFDQSSKAVVSNYSNEILGQLVSNYSNEKFAENDRPIIRLAPVKRDLSPPRPPDALEEIEREMVPCKY